MDCTFSLEKPKYSHSLILLQSLGLCCTPNFGEKTCICLNFPQFYNLGCINSEVLLRFAEHYEIMTKAKAYKNGSVDQHNVVHTSTC